MRNTRIWRCCQSVALVCVSVSALNTGAGEASPDTSTILASGELAKEKHNPFADVHSTGCAIARADIQAAGQLDGQRDLFQPAIPFSLGEDWKLIVRPDFSLLATEPPDRKLGLGDIELQTYFTPALFHNWVWGVGPVLQAPTATDRSLGTGKWSVGPGVGFVYMNGPWVNGILANHVWSFAGASDRDAVSQSMLEPVISYNFDSGWYLAFDSTMTADWNAPAGKRWTIPVGMDAGKAFQIGKHSVSVQFGTYCNVKRAEGAGRWLVRLQVSFIFPKRTG